MRKTAITMAVTAAALSVAAGCRTASQSAEKTEMRHTERLIARDSAAVRRNMRLDKPVVTVEYADSPARRITLAAERIETRADDELRSTVQTAASDSVGVASGKSKTATPPFAGLPWIGVGAAFVAGLLCSPRSRNRDQSW